MSDEVTVSKKVLHFKDPQNNPLGKMSRKEFLGECCNPPKYDERQQKIVIGKNPDLPVIHFDPTNISFLNPLSFKISNEDICAIMQQVFNFERDPSSKKRSQGDNREHLLLLSAAGSHKFFQSTAQFSAPLK